ncbi:MAG: sigma 54-interacting transcriptional regulator [Bradymonadia bacterium]|jgi:DNA-binding NtrC family response regulator
MQSTNTKPSHKSTRIHNGLLALAVLLFIGSLLLSLKAPSLDFELATQAVSGQNSLVVQASANNSDDALRVGDQIEAVNGKIVRSRAEFWYQLLFAKDKSAEITVKRYGTLFQRQLSPASFAAGGIPLGLRRGDKPVRMTSAKGGDVVVLEDIDFEALKDWVEGQCEELGCLVTFRRSEDLQNISIKLYNNTARTSFVLMSLLILLMMGSTWMQRRRRIKQWSDTSFTLLNLSLLTGFAALLHLGIGPSQLCMPPLFLLTLIGLGLFKVFHLALHLNLRSSPSIKERALRVVLYIGPIATLVFPTFMLLKSMNLLWGGSVSAEMELRIDTMRLLVILWFLLYTALDAALCIWHHFTIKKTPFSQKIKFSDITLIIGFFLALAAFIYLPTNHQRLVWFLIASIIVQLIGDFIESIKKSDGSDSVCSQGILSTSVVRDLLHKAQSIVGNDYSVFVLVDRPNDKHCVGLTLDEDESSLSGITVVALEAIWKDFLEVLRTEGGVFPRAETTVDEADPIPGMAYQLGIALAWPLLDAAAGSLTSLSFVVLQHDEDETTTPPSLAQRAALNLMRADFIRASTTFAYLSAELSLQNQDIAIGSPMSPSQFLRTAQILAASTVLPAQALPHGLLDEEETDVHQEEENSKADDTLDAYLDPDLTLNPFEAETKILEDHVQQLQSQIIALQNQQLRNFALSEIELTQDQVECLNDIIAIGAPLLLLGESGVGKQLLALAAHNSMGGGTFLSIDVAQLPLAVLGLELFGENDEGGLIKAAVGGSLLINNVDRLNIELINDIMDAAEALQNEEAIRLFFSINSKFDEIACEGVQRCDLQIPEKYREIAENCDAEIVFLPPLRMQENALQIAEFFMYKEAMHFEKPITRIDAEAMDALKAYQWPGNFGELHGVIAQAVMRCQTKTLTLADLGRDFENYGARTSSVTMSFEDSERLREQVQFMQALNETQQNLIQELRERIETLEKTPKLSLVEPNDETQSSLLEGTFHEIEYKLLQGLLQKYGNDKEEALKHLELSRTIFFNKLGKHGLN